MRGFGIFLRRVDHGVKFMRTTRSKRCNSCLRLERFTDCGNKGYIALVKGRSVARIGTFLGHAYNAQ
jgi:hypothetical protein